MELLSPAGSMEALKAAVENGADAVYLGGGAFNARADAKTPEDLKEAVQYCRLRNRKVYFTLNTLVLDKEFKAFLELAYKAARCGVNAFIAQDLGAGDVLKKEFPKIPVHASTQMTVTNSYAAKTLEELGYKRIILARELTKSEITSIHKKVDIPLEAFAHGALCQGYSGQCLLSSFLGGRSANRGECAQPCRLKYESGEKDGHLLSAKDLCLVKYVKQLEECGVSSLKIEGRLKRAEYVAIVTKIYRRAIDGAEISDNDIDDLKAVFNRGAFTSGKFGGDKDRLYAPYPGHIGLPLGKITRIRIKDNRCVVDLKTERKPSAGDIIIKIRENAKPCRVLQADALNDGCRLVINKNCGFNAGDEIRLIYDKSLTEELAYKKAGCKTPLNAYIEIETDKPASLRIEDPEGKHCAVVFGKSAQKAVNRAVTDSEVISQLEKTGDYPFYFNSIDVQLAENAAYPKSALNELRRNALEKYADILTRVPEISEPDFDLPNKLRDEIKRRTGKPKLAAYAENPEQARAVEGFADIVYLPANKVSDFQKYNAIPALAPVCGDKEIKSAYSVFEECGAALLTTPVPFDGVKIADYTFNITNLFSLYVLSRLGYSRAVLSLELTAPQIRDLTAHSPIETEVAVYGKINLMITANCPIDCKGSDCALEKGSAFLKDRMNKKFSLKKSGENCRVAILNSVPIYMADKLSEVHADVMRLVFTDEPPERCAEIAETYANALNGDIPKTPNGGEFTRGHFYRGYAKYE